MRLLEEGTLEFIWSGVFFSSHRLSYANVVNRKECEAQVINFKGAKYKKFLHAADAELWVHQNAVGPYATQKTPPIAAPPATLQVGVNSPEAHESPSLQALSPSSMAASSPAKTGETPLNHRFGERAISEKPQVMPQHSALSTSKESVSTTMSSNSGNTMIVYTDGSCRGNGRVGSEAGIGVWWGKDDPRHVAPIVSFPHS